MAEHAVSLVVGADGFVGRELSACLARLRRPALETTRRRPAAGPNACFLDLAGDIGQWRPPRPVSVAYLCAAVTSIDECRRDPTRAFRVNVENTVALARSLAEADAFVVFPSTNLVYDGSAPCRNADEPPRPAAAYGRHKAEAERGLLALDRPVAVVRFTKLVARQFKLFQDWVSALRRGRAIHPFSDMVFAPLPLQFAVEALLGVAASRLSGILQVSGERDVTYAEAAEFIARELGADHALVQPVTAASAGLPPESVPRHTTLSNDRLREELNLSPPDVWATVRACLPIADAEHSQGKH